MVLYRDIPVHRTANFKNHCWPMQENIKGGEWLYCSWWYFWKMVWIIPTGIKLPEQAIVAPSVMFLLQLYVKPEGKNIWMGQAFKWLQWYGETFIANNRYHLRWNSFVHVIQDGVISFVLGKSCREILFPRPYWVLSGSSIFDYPMYGRSFTLKNWYRKYMKAICVYSLKDVWKNFLYIYPNKG